MVLVHDLSGVLWVGNGRDQAMQRCLDKAPDQIGIAFDHVVSSDDAVAVIIKASIGIGKADDLLRRRGRREQWFADRELANAVDPLASQQARQGIAIGGDPLRITRIKTGNLSIGRKQLWHRAECGVGERLAIPELLST